MRRCLCLIAILGMGAAAPLAAPAAESPLVMPEGVELRSFEGEAGVLRLFSEDTGVSALLAPGFGGRILFYGIEGQNLLWLPQRNSPTAPLTTGGYQLSLGPEIRNIPPSPTLSRGQYRSRMARDFTVEVRSLPDPLLGVQLIKEVVIDPESGDLGLSQTVTNVSPREVSFCQWDRTLVQPDGYVIVPLNKKSQFEEKWAVREGRPGEYRYNGDTPESDRVEISRGNLYAKASGKPTTIGLDSDAGWIAYAWRHFLFVKYFPHYRTGDYTDGGCTVKVSWNENHVELQPLSPEVKLKPGEAFRFPGFWKIVELKDEVKSFKDARKASKKVPRSPFGR